MKEEIRTRPGTWGFRAQGGTCRLVIGSIILLFCAQASLAIGQSLPGGPLSALFESDATYSRGRLLVRFADTDAQLPGGPVITGPRTRLGVRAALSDYVIAGASVDKGYDGIVPGLTLVELPPGVSVLDAVMEFNQLPNVLYAQPDYKFWAMVVPNDPLFDQQWGMDNTGQTGGLPDADIDAPEAWDITTGRDDIIVAITDTGIDYNHPDLMDNMWINDGEVNQPGVVDVNDINDVDDDGNGYNDDIYGYDFVDDDWDPMDENYHGTHVAGIVGAVGDNGEGVAGTCWTVKLMALRVLDANGEGVTSDFVEAIEYATAWGVEVINASWGGYTYDQPLYDAIAAAGEAGILFVASAGNDGYPFAAYPAGFGGPFGLDNIIAVMSTDHFDNMSWFSNYSDYEVHLGAPGSAIISTTPITETDAMGDDGVPTDYAIISGTSQAAPHVSGACALIRSVNPDVNHLEIKQIIMRGVDPVLPGLCISGGRLNLFRSLNIAKPGVVLNTRTLARYPSIQDAIDEAIDGDELIADANNWYLERIDFLGKSIIVRSGDVNDIPFFGVPSPRTTYISAMFDVGRVVTLGSGEDANTALIGFSIVDGTEGIYVENSAPQISDCNITVNMGSGIYCANSVPDIVDCTITANSAFSHGGGIYCNANSDANISNCAISGNTSARNGGGICCSNDSDAKITDCIILGNTSSGYGGGIYCDNDSDPNITDCTISANTAVWEGGGIYCSNALPEIIACTITDNRTQWDGGGIFCDIGSDPNIRNCTISNNVADYDGGGIYCNGSFPLIKNCLILNNAVDSWDGGGIFCLDASPTIINCTLVGNSANDYDGRGGALFCTGASAPAVTNCIFSDNNDIAINEGGPDSDPDVSFCLFYHNPHGDYSDYDTGTVYDVNTVDPNNVLSGRNNIGADPMFVRGRLGDYYLSQYEAGQILDANGQVVDPNVNPEDATSPAVDAGSADANSLDMHRYSTRTDNFEDPNGNKDLGLVDIGYHYDDPQPAVQYSLITSVAPFGTGLITPDPAGNPHVYTQYVQVPLEATPSDPNVYQFRGWNGTDDDTRIDLEPSGAVAEVQKNIVTIDTNKMVSAIFETILVNLRTRVIGGVGTVTPRAGSYPRGTVVQLTATPANPSHRVRWVGADDPYSTARDNTVTMVAPFMVDPQGREYKEVEVTFYAPRTLLVPGDYTNLQHAIDDAYDGDIIVIEQAEDPNHPYLTVTGFEIYGKAITITSQNPDDPCCVASTVIEMQPHGPDGGNYPAFYLSGVNPDMILDGITIRGFQLTGQNGRGGSPDDGYYDGVPGEGMYGAALVLYSASPTIRNCVITDCSVTGGNGGGGAQGNADHDDYPRSQGGHGGWPGSAYGGGMACLFGSNPRVINCVFEDCEAIGGNGGDGGNGDSDGGLGGRGGGWYYPYEPSDYPYLFGSLQIIVIPEYPYDFGPFDFYTWYSGHGGAVYSDAESSPTFMNCTFRNNRTEGGVCGISGQSLPGGFRDEPTIRWKIDNFGGAVFVGHYPVDYYYGGIIYYPGYEPKSEAEFVDCTFVDNVAEPNVTQDHEDQYISYGGAVAFVEGAMPTFDTCLFNNNLATIGGGMFWEWSDPIVEDCNFVANEGLQGGGVYLVGGSSEICRNYFRGNDANGAGGAGGGIYCFDVNALIADCTLTGNDANGAGGGIYIGGSERVTVNNCLIVRNSASRDGAGISANWHSEPNIINCTIVGNIATGDGFPKAYGGGVYCSYNSFTTITDSIIWGNVANPADPNATGHQIAVGTGFEFDPIPGTVVVSYSDIMGWQTRQGVNWVDPNAVFVDVNCFLGWDFGSIIDEEPLFIRDYFLSQIAAGQLVDSPAINAGSDLAANVGMDTYSTRTDLVRDDGIVDLGYHYEWSGRRYRLTVNVTGPGTVALDPKPLDPNNMYNENATVEVKGIPEPSYYVRGWYDANNVLVSVDKTLEVVMDADKIFRVVFGPPVKIEVSGDPNAIIDAVEAARSGDTLVIAAGTYNGNINLQGKDIRLASTNPDDPNIVVNTIIDCNSTGRAFIFDNDEDANTVIDGLTIVNGGAPNEPGGAIFIDANSSPTIVNVIILNCNVTDANGGAIYIGSNSRPTFRNCTISNCSAVGVGGLGGAAFCDVNSLPVFADCNFSDNYSSNGGGAIFYDVNSTSMLNNCLFVDNVADANGGAIYYGIGCTSEVNDCNFVGNTALANGGAILFDPNNLITIVDSNFTSCSANYGGALYVDPNCSGSISAGVLLNNDANEDGGAMYLGEVNDLTIADCNMASNSALRGGGLFCINSPAATVIDCTINYNQAVRFVTTQIDPNDPNTIITFEDPTVTGQGGGVYSFAGPALITNTDVSYNISQTSGGGIYLAGKTSPHLKNCLITNNIAARDGGGISANWEIEPKLSNCTIADNSVRDLPAYGGGLYFSYDSNAVVIDSIISGNVGIMGSQIAIASGDPFYPLPSAVKVTYSNVEEPNYALEALDVVFCIDTTSTMAGDIAAIQAAAREIVDLIAKMFPNYRIAIVDYRDFAQMPYGSPAVDYPYNDVLTFETDPDVVLAAINSLTLGFGGDIPESVYSALMHCIDGTTLGGWRRGDVSRVIILMGDAPPHDPEPFTGYTLGDVTAAAMAGDSKRIFSLMVRGNAVTAGYFSGLADGTGGIMFQAAATGYVVDALMDVIRLIMPVPIYVEDGCVINWDPNDSWYPDSHNIAGDPNFVMGPLGDYYLSQIAAGPLQLVDSNCVNAGSSWAAANSLGMNKFTTRTDLVSDTGKVDMGYHYPLDKGIKYELVLVVTGPGTVAVEPNAVDPNNILYDPQDNVYTYKYYRGTSCLLTAKPDAGYRVKNWNGTDEDPSWNTNINTVTMDGDKVVRVEFEPDMTRNLLVPTEYTTIEEAIAAASYGDNNIIVDKGTHYVSGPNGIDLAGKSITLMSTDPDDPNVIADTIIDCLGSRTSPRRAFHFHSGEDPNSVIMGFTIRGGFVVGATAPYGQYGVLTPVPYTTVCSDDDPPPPRAEAGQDAAGNGYGGAILCENESSPTFKNCVITGNTVIAAWGGDGADGQDQFLPYTNWSYLPLGATDVEDTDNGQWGGHGGDGSGNGYGGGMACLDKSCPVIIDCTFENNAARGGYGGNGGDGGNASGGAASHGGDGGDAFGDGIGGAIYCENGSTPIIRDCIFINNAATSGIPGVGGQPGAGDPLEDLSPPCPAARAGFNGGVVIYDTAGGAVAYTNSDANLVDCTFSDNASYQVYIAGVYFPGQPIVLPAAYTRGGALYSQRRNVVTIQGCEFTDNLAGAVYCDPNCVLDVNDCLFKENSNTLDGGAIYIAETGLLDVNNCTFLSNSAYSHGGAVSCQSDANFVNCLFRANEASDTGGAIDAFYDSTDPNIITTLNLNFESCSFAKNESLGDITGWGGAVHFFDFNASFTDCYFLDNKARCGGGLFLVDGDVTVTRGNINRNRAVGGAGGGFTWTYIPGIGFVYSSTGSGFDVGGAMICVNTAATIKDCTLKDNAIDGAEGSGGAINFYGGYVKHLVQNCLITGNAATIEGGAISANLFATPEIENCTFGDNWAGSLGGAVYCDWSSDANIIDSIFANCDNYAIAEEDFNNPDVKYCLFYENRGGDYAVYNTATEKIDVLSGVELDATNIAGDPTFTTGPFGDYYLSQTAAGQVVDSPAVNAGSELAYTARLSGYTTRTDGVGDMSKVDIGYHYAKPSNVRQFELVVAVPEGHGRIEAREPAPVDSDPVAGTYTYYDGTLVTLKAIPDPGYRFVEWTGTDDDSSLALVNSAMMYSNRAVTAEFEPAQTFYVPGQYHTINDAFNATDADGEPIVHSGDTVVVASGTYNEVNIDFDGRSIIITSRDPDDPCCVASTIIDCDLDGSGGYGRAFIFRGGETDAVIDGFTIINGNAVGYYAVLYEFYAGTGGDGADAYGGAIASFGPSSPTIINCVIKDCVAIGGHGGNGQDIFPPAEGPGGDGGDGGIGYGGAMYFESGSEPTIRSCKIINCRAEGGKSGRGGHANGNDWWGGDAGDGGEGYGGAMYFEPDCKVTVQNCIIDECGTLQGEGNIGGNADGRGAGGAGGVNGTESWAGAIFYGENCEATYTETTITNCIADTDIQKDWPGGTSPNGPYGPWGYSFTSSYAGANYYSSSLLRNGCKAELTRCVISDNKVVSDQRILSDGQGGAEHYQSDCTVILNSCTFAGNKTDAGSGGAEFFDWSCAVEVNDCSFSDSFAGRDGGAIALASECILDINDSSFGGNWARGPKLDENVYYYSSYYFGYYYGLGYRTFGCGGALYWDEGGRVTINNSYFAANKAEYGGGLYWYGSGRGSDVTISDSVISGNAADHGGGLYWNHGAPIIKGCTIAQNTAEGGRLWLGDWEYEDVYGGGGGAFCWMSDATIKDCSFGLNSSSGSGGGVYLGGGGAPTMKNCLVRENSAVLDGGGIASAWFVTPTISNCTIADNNAYDPASSDHGRGGGLSCRYQSKTTLTDSILWGNTATSGDQIAVGRPSDPNLIDRPAELTVSYCDIAGWPDTGAPGSVNPDAVFVAPDQVLNWDFANMMDEDPLFVAGPLGGYYLSQIAAGQTEDSPAVNAGSKLSVLAGLLNYTTRTDNGKDTGTVDLGYHYRDVSGLPKFELTVGVSGRHGTVEPVEPEPVSYDPASGVYTYYAGTLVTLIATPEPGYRVAGWAGGTVSDSSKEKINYVVMGSDRDIIVRFEQPRTIRVPEDHPTIQRGIDAAEEGDVVVVNTGVYRNPWGHTLPLSQMHLGGIAIWGKNITLRSENPDDPNTVAHTIIQGYQLDIVDVGPETLIAGFTIRDTFWFTGNGLDGDGTDGFNGGCIASGAIELTNASPRIVNVVIDNISITAGDGGDGDDGCPGFNGGWGGSAYGGAFFMRNSSPTLKGVRVLNCRAYGGTGGDGGDCLGMGGRGGSWTFKDRDEQWWEDMGLGWDWPMDRYGNMYYDPDAPLGLGGEYEDYWLYTAMGGAVYIDANSNPAFTDCTFANNETISGYCGLGGATAHWPDYHERIESFGGAVYCEIGSAPTFVDCTFNNNVCDSNVPMGNHSFYPTYGGALCYGSLTPRENLGSGRSATLIRCTFTDNSATIGGAIFWADTTPTIQDCNFSGNYAYKGAAMSCSESKPTIIRCNIGENDVGYTFIFDPNSYYTEEFDDPDVDLQVGPPIGDVQGLGGGIYFSSSGAQVADSNFSDNTASGYGGGAYWSKSTMTVSDCNFVRNTASSGAGIASVDSAGAISRCTVADNAASTARLADPNDPGSFDYLRIGQGGGYYCFSSPVDVNDSIFTGNWASASGGGIYFGSEDEGPHHAPILHNCLLVDNAAGRDGGGISSNRYVEPTISNCTIADNVVTGILGEGPGYGGGLYCSYESIVKVVNSIIWGNIGFDGAQVAVDTGFEYEPKASNLTIIHSDIGPPYDPNLFATILDSNEPFVADWPQGATTGILVDGQTIYDKFAAGQDKVDVIVTLVDPAELRAATNWNSSASVRALRAEVAKRQSAVLSSLGPAEFSLKYRYENLSAVSGAVTRGGLEKLLKNDSVAHIEPVRELQWALRQAIPLANALEARQAYDGTGAAVAIVDSGVDYTHPMLGGGGFPNSKVIGGYDFGSTDPDPIHEGMAHGTCCAGIAAGSLGTVGDYIGGVAYNARIYALKISVGMGGPLSGAALAAWDWCITHRNDDPANPIKVMSNSWGVSIPFSDPAVADAYSPAMTHAADTAEAVGITILAASGNDGFPGWGISWPAAMSKVISVGAVYDTTDLVTGYSNTADNLDILAPADPVYTTDIVGPFGYAVGDYFPFFNGTSSATPFAAGVVASIQSAARDKLGRYLTPAEVKNLLIKTGDPVTDNKFDPIAGMQIDISKPRVNLGRAIASPTGPPIYVDQGCILNGWVAPEPNNYWNWDPNKWDVTSQVIEEDPNFIFGYYLSQLDAGQITESNCVEGGSDLASVIGLDTYTTRIDGVNDLNIVDMGYHYRKAVTQYQLTVTVVEDLNDPGIHGTVEPNSGLYYDGTVVTLRTKPDPGYYLKGWYDVNDVLVSIAKELDVVMDSNQVFRVRFRLPSEVEVSGGGDAIVDAVDTAENGDTLIVAAGTYNGGINFRGKELKLLGTNPDDPNVVANTIIDCRNTGRAFTFNSGEDAGAVVDGLSIINGSLAAGHGGAMYIGSGSSPSIFNVAISDCNVAGNGGAIYVDANSSPSFANVTISNCATVPYAYLVFPNDPNSLFTIPGGNGGGVFIDVNCGPTFTSCTITDCSADGFGGALYCGTDSSATFADCNFTDNQSSFSGGGHYYASESVSALNGCVFTGNTTDSAGGGIYYNVGCESEVIDCNFTGNTASGGFVYSYQTDPNDPNSIVIFTDDFTMGKGGGIGCNANSSIRVIDSRFAENSAEFGGGLYFDPNCSGLISETVLVHNDANEDGGAIYFTDTNDLSVADCNIAFNRSTRGGGLYCVDSPESTIIRCFIKYNKARRVYYEYFMIDPNDPVAPPIPGGDPNDPNTIVVEREDVLATAQGGGVYSFAGPTLIADSEVSDNTATTSGGGLYLTAGADQLTRLKNCLVTDNSAGRDGGGVSVSWYSDLLLSYCTIAGNVAGDVNDPNSKGFGGGLYCSYESNATLIDSIIWGNLGNDGSQISVGTGFKPDPRPASVSVSYCDVMGWKVAGEPNQIDPNAVFVDTGCSLNWDFGSIIDKAPLFVGGYYLSHIAAGQTTNSPAIDAGSDFAVILGMDEYTTALNGAPDTGKVDLGYHSPIASYRLSITVIGNGTVDIDPDLDPNDLYGGWYNRNTVVTLTARPDPLNRVKGWYDVNEVLLSIDKVFKVMMGSDEAFILKFEPTRIIDVAGDPNAIQQAIDQAKSGDTLIVAMGTYNGDITLRGKDITLVCTNPDDPNVVASTIIDGQQSGRGFIFNNEEDPNTVVDGFTIINGSVGDEGGAGIYVDANCSPTIMNVTIRDSAALSDPNDPGSYATGGGIYVGVNSRPTFMNCTVITCSADEGGGAFCDFNSAPLFNHCSFIDNTADLGAGISYDANCVSLVSECIFSGNIAVEDGGGLRCDPNGLITIADCNFADNSANRGAGLYCDPNGSVAIADSMFIGNTAVQDGGAVYWAGADVVIADSNMVSNSALRGAGLWCGSSPATTITRCKIERNRAGPIFDPNDPSDPNALVIGEGGGIYCFDVGATIVDCNMTSNVANTSGGGIYISGSNTVTVKNCLITNNFAGRDGGGASVNWYVRAFISNCTFVGNAAPGTFGDVDNTGFGGGLYCSYESKTEVVDSIFWNNYALGGYEIAVSTGFRFIPRPATVTVSYCDVRGGRAGVRVDNGCTLNWGAGNIDSKPLFVNGPLGAYYLSQRKAGQSTKSPCVDTGSDYASHVTMTGYTTRTDQIPDTDRVDMGYHHPTAEPCRFCDLVFDGIIDFADFAILASRWLDEGCSDLNAWCDGADLTFDRSVGFEDIAFLCECWLVEDIYPPIPDPSRWEIKPHLTSSTSIGMTAEPAFDAWGWDVQYWFERMPNGYPNSGWRDEPTWVDTGVTPGIRYGYRVKARDTSPNLNETGWSTVAYAGVEDLTPPTPAPTWLTAPYPLSETAIAMVATTAYDESGVEYYFENFSGNGHDSGWQTEPNYTDTGLDPNTEYCYRVRARDRSPNANQTEWSVTACATTLVPLDTTPPTPDPMIWDPNTDPNGFDGTPREVYVGPGNPDWQGYDATMRAVVAVDASGFVEYYFDCIDRSDFSSRWQVANTYTVFVDRKGIGLRFRVRARDLYGNMTAWSVVDKAD